MKSTWADMTEDFAPWWQAVTWPDGSVTPGWPTEQKTDALLEGVAVEGKRAYDVGCMAGISAMVLERRGAAEVIGFDIEPRCRLQFEQLRRAFSLRARFDLLSAYDVIDSCGPADIVLLMGVYYHLRHPLLALERLWSGTRDVLLIEGEVDEAGWNAPMIATYWPNSYYGDESTWWVPTLPCLYAWCDGLQGHGQIDVLYPMLSPRRAGVRVWRHGVGPQVPQPAAKGR